MQQAALVRFMVRDLNLPVTTSEQIGNPNFTACLDRKA
jgi:hypothetical protein